ncbi:peroxiredoxin-like family protein [Clostridium ganghwense]|uniref:thioredoxin-dependent peroxiredoxin n=1 Tax=Clostridium ganghwense TaxID=312089 RepID=A0ABT4CQT3_9CLOT|nr:peroxiredoxin-like family protein [Clostridium ganghwense]MCY6370586.1 peroxiredoxin-like family protein [Clostridium ganghwense]
MNLNLELKKFNEDFLNKAPKDIIDLLRSQAENLAQKGVEKKALKVGDKIPHFILRNAVGEKIDSHDLLEKGPLVISFYRGAWCPYCNLELHAYQEILPEIKALGAQLVAISPELPDNSMSLIEKYLLKYEVLSDIENKVAQKFGLSFQIEEEFKSLYKGVGIDLVATQGNDNYELPIPATYVVDTNGNIVLDYVNIDYTNRLEPKEVIKSLERL